MGQDIKVGEMFVNRAVGLHISPVGRKETSSMVIILSGKPHAV